MKIDYIECGDCLSLMKEMPEKCVDVCFTSPPYNDTGSKNDTVEYTKYGNNTHRKYLFVETRKDWFEWQCEVIDEMLRVSKKLVIYNIQGLTNNRKDLYRLIGKYADRIHDIVIWYKPNGTPTSTPHKLSNTYEYLLLIKPDGVKGVDVQSNFYRNVIVKNVNTNKEYKKIHRAVMSKDFCDEVIKEFTAPGDVVLDPFLGVATTCISCIEQNRHYIGFELNETYYEEALKRISEVQLSIPLENTNKEEVEEKKDMDYEEMIKRVEKYANRQNDLLTSTIEDYQDDLKSWKTKDPKYYKEQKDYIGSLKEEREGWRDILRIIHGYNDLYNKLED